MITLINHRKLVCSKVEVINLSFCDNTRLGQYLGGSLVLAKYNKIVDNRTI